MYILNQQQPTSGMASGDTHMLVAAMYTISWPNMAPKSLMHCFFSVLAHGHYLSQTFITLRCDIQTL
jgi:hypothetical protein